MPPEFGIVVDCDIVSSKINGNIPEEVLDKLDLELSYEQENMSYSTAVQSGHWDGRRRLFSKKTKVLPSGLLTKAESILKAAGIPFAVRNIFSRISTTGTPIKFNMPLYPWQDTIVKDSLHHRRGIIKSATGSGKGVMMLATIAKLNLNTVILVHRTDLMIQLAKRWKEYTGNEIGIVGNSIVDIKPITIAMAQTVIKALEGDTLAGKRERMEKDSTKLSQALKDDIIAMVGRAEAVMVDECHRVPCSTFYSVLKKFTNAQYRLGYSATPWREVPGEDMVMEAALGKRIADVSLRWLIDSGFLAKPTILFVTIKHAKQSRALNYQELYDKEIIQNVDRNNKIVEAARNYYNQGKRILIAVNWIPHGLALNELISKFAKDDVRVINAKLGDSEREAAPEELNTGKFKIAIVTSVWKEGIDIPGIDILINAQCGKSRVQTLQVAGRALRKTTDKDKAILIDFLDIGCRYFKEHGMARIEAYKAENLEVIVR